jgi:transcriptional regulator with XRE-family HTH domain
MGKTLRSDAHATLVMRLKQVRESAGLTQAVVAERLGKPQSYVAKTESGERRLDVVEFVALSIALEADPAMLVQEVRHALAGGAEEGDSARPSAQAAGN